jgi:hypothetical protein
MGKIKRVLAVMLAALLLALAIKMSGLQEAETASGYPAPATVASPASGGPAPAATSPVRVYLYPAPPDSAGTGMAVYTTYLAGEDGVPRQAFAPGEPVRLFGMLVNPGEAAVGTWALWTLSGPCGSQVLWSGALTLEPDVWALYLDGAAPAACPGTHIAILTVSAGGLTSAHSTEFAVGQ